jgi:sulfur-oxidizing protein SoxZ
MARALINVPKQAKAGEIITIKTLISHEMETGYRHDNVGELLPRNIITSFVCKYNGEEIFRADLFPAISANTFTFIWTGDRGFSQTESATIIVE